MKFEETKLPGVFLVTPEERRDGRGMFAETFNLTEFGNHGLSFFVDQVNVSASMKAGTVRGLHWQEAPDGQVKLVRCLMGEIRDVVVDVRPESPSYGKHVSIWLQAGDLQSVYVPKGCAHGWQALRDYCQTQYLVGGPWRKDAERGLRPDDPGLGIVWPLPVANLNDRDAGWPLFVPR